MILLVSGGIDSYIAWNFLNRPKVLFVDYGQPYIGIEGLAVKKLYGDVEFVKLDGIASLRFDKVFVPARNLMLATLGLRYSTDIAFGGVKDEICKDKSPLAFKLMSGILSKFNDHSVNVFSPIWHFTKSDAVRYFIENFDSRLLSDTVSCYSVDVCNNCESCFRRFVAMAFNGLFEPSRLPKDEIVCEFIKNLNLQPCNRAFEIVVALCRSGYNVGLEFVDDNVRVSYSGVECSVSGSLGSQLRAL